MALMTRCATCVPPGPSRKAAGWPLTVWESEGNWERTWARSRVVEGAVSVVGILPYFYHAMLRLALNPPRSPERSQGPDQPPYEDENGCPARKSLETAEGY